MQWYIFMDHVWFIGQFLAHKIIQNTFSASMMQMKKYMYLFVFAGKKEIFQHSIQLNAEFYTPVDGELIPTGEIHSVANTDFDLRVPKMMGDIIGSKI